jgi:general secretion pathway protein A
MHSTSEIWRHFGIEDDPFGVTPDPRFIHFNTRFRPIVGALYEAIFEGRCFGAVSGPPGTGKTTLANYLMQQLGEATDVVHLDCAFRTEEELLHGVMATLGLPPEQDGFFSNWLRLRAHLLERHGQGRRVVLIYDEAHRLTPELLESVRLFWNLETTRAKLVQIILLGQPGLIQMIRSRELEQLAQRLTVVYEFPPLEQAEVRDYIDYRMEMAGATKRVFYDDAVESITRLSRGIPRNINTVCFQALRLAFQRNRTTIDARLIGSIGTALPGHFTLAAPVDNGLSAAPRALAPHEIEPARRAKRKAVPSSQVAGLLPVAGTSDTQDAKQPEANMPEADMEVPANVTSVQ